MAITTIDIEVLESAINCCRKQGGQNGLVVESGTELGVLGPELRHLGDIYGAMIFQRCYKEFPLSGFPAEAIEALERWVSKAQAAASVE